MSQQQNNFPKVTIKDLILNFEFEKAEKKLRKNMTSNLSELKLGHASMNLCIIGILKTLITNSEADFDSAICQLEETKKNSENIFTAMTLQLYPKADMFTAKTLQHIDDSRFTISEDEDFVKCYLKRSISEIISAECSLLQIFMHCIRNGEHSNIFNTVLIEPEMMNFRSAFMVLYHAYERFKILPEGNPLKTGGTEYQDELKLSWGLCSLLTLLLPSQLSTIMGTSEFKLTKISDSLELIESASSGKGVHALLSCLILIMYHADIKNELDNAKKYLNALNQPKSAMFQYFQAKLLRLEQQTSSSIEVLTNIRVSSAMLKFPIYWQMIQCFAESQKWLEAAQYIRTLREFGYPSKIFSLYLEASFIQASTGRAFGPLSIEVQALLKKVLLVAREKHKVPRPVFDRLAIIRARDVLERNEHFFLPHYEILLLWDRFKGIEHKEFVVNQVRKALESSGQLTLEQQTLGWLILTILSDSPVSSTKLIINHILPREKALPTSNFTCIRAKCELAHCYLLEGKVEIGRQILNEIEMNCFDKNGYPGQTTILLLLSRLKQKLDEFNKN